MSLTQTLAPHLPYLRRYARALTGSQTSGDAYVRAALSALVEGDQALVEGVSPRVGLYRLFHAIWSTASGRLEEREDGKDGAQQTPEARLRALDSHKRAALLLTAVEAFSIEETAFILDEGADDVERAILDARLEPHQFDAVVMVGGATRMPMVRSLVARMFGRLPLIHVDPDTTVALGAAIQAGLHRRDEAVSKALAERPGLVLADINLGEGGSGIDAVTEILNSFDIPVIFITAYPEKLLTGERPEPTYLIAKPFLPETVQATVGQALFFHPAARKAA